jgi:hypothetical protein
MHERYLVAKTMSQSITSTRLDGTTHTKGANIDKIPMAIIRLEKLEKSMERKQDEANKIYDEIDETISRIQGKGASGERELLRMRYLDLMSLKEINEVLFGREADFLEREESFRKRTFIIHKKALQSLGELLPDCEEIEEKRGEKQNEI